MGWTGGCWIVWAGVGWLLCRPEGSDVALPCKKNQKEEGSARALPVAAPMPKSDSFSERRENA